MLALCPRCGKLRREYVRANRHRLGIGWLHGTCECCDPADCSAATYFLDPCCSDVDSICFDGGLGTFSVNNVVLFGNCCYTIKEIDVPTPDVVDNTIDPNNDFTLQNNCAVAACGCCPDSAKDFKATISGVDASFCVCGTFCGSTNELKFDPDGVYTLTRSPSTSCTGIHTTSVTHYDVQYNRSCVLQKTYTSTLDMDITVTMRQYGACLFLIDSVSLNPAFHPDNTFSYKDSLSATRYYFGDSVPNQLSCDGATCGHSDGGTVKVELV